MVSDELAEAEWKLREFSGGNWIGDYFAENEAAGVVLKELARLRAVEKAAAALVDVIENKLWHIDGKLVVPLDTLKDALNGDKT